MVDHKQHLFVSVFWLFLAHHFSRFLALQGEDMQVDYSIQVGRLPLWQLQEFPDSAHPLSPGHASCPGLEPISQLDTHANGRAKHSPLEPRYR